MTTTTPGPHRGFLFAVLAAPAMALVIFFVSLFAGVGGVGAVAGACACPIAAFAGAKVRAIATGQAVLLAGIALLALIAALSLLAVAMAFAYGHVMAGFN